MAAKLFEVGDVLPATTQLRISWMKSILFYSEEYYYVATNNDGIALFDVESSYISYYDGSGDVYIYDGLVLSEPYTDYDGNHAYIDIDTSSWNELERTISTVYYSSIDSSDLLVWEDLNASSGFSVTFEENGGSTVTDLTEQTALPNPLPTTTKANHVFAGWYYDNLFTQKANAGDELTTNVTLYAKWYTPTTWCEDIADAIREKDGTTEPIKHLDFPERILAIESGIDVSDANAVVGEVLAGKTFYAVDDTRKTGTMPNRGTVSTDITTKAQEVTIQQGYHSGSGKVKISTTEQAKIIASNIKSGVTILGQEGAVIPAKEEETKTVTPDFSSGNQVITPTSGKVMTQVTINKDSNLIADNIKKDITVHGITGTLESGGGIISLMATSEYNAIKTGTQSSALRWRCSTELFNKPIFIDANGNLYTPAQVGVYFNGTYKTRADTTLYTFGTYSTTMTGRITFKTVSGGIIVSLINLNYSEEFWGTGVYFSFGAYISWSPAGGTTGVSLQTQWASICSVQKTWLNNFSDITDGYCSDSAVIGSTIIANGGAIGGFSIHLEDPD